MNMNKERLQSLARDLRKTPHRTAVQFINFSCR